METSISEIDLKRIEQEYESRKQRLEDLKEEYKNVLFEEFVDNQGDFMNIEIPKLEKEGMVNKNVHCSNGQRKSLYFTEEEKLFIETFPENKTQINTRYNNLMSIERSKLQPRATILPAPDKEKLIKEVNEKIEELKVERDKLCSEYETVELNHTTKVKDIISKREKEYEEYQIMINNLPKENNKILKYFTEDEFNEKFWKYISENVGFKLKDKTCICSKCGKIPTVNRICYNTKEDGIKIKNGACSNGILKFTTQYLYRNGTTSYSLKQYFASGVINYITCCKFLYDFEDKKLYKIGYPGKEYKIAFGGIFGNQYIPCDEYDMKTKRDLWNETIELRNEVLKLSYLEQRMQALENILNN
jgi:hypothetical protein